jgi:hypothetical protein
MTVRVGSLLHGFVEFLHPIAFLQDLARFCAVGRADNAVLLHQVNQARGAAIANSQAALKC